MLLKVTVDFIPVLLKGGDIICLLKRPGGSRLSCEFWEKLNCSGAARTAQQHLYVQNNHRRSACGFASENSRASCVHVQTGFEC